MVAQGRLRCRPLSRATARSADSFAQHIGRTGRWREVLEVHGAPHFRSAIDKPDLADKLVAERLAETRALKFPKTRTKLDDFEALALAEFDLARRMDETACRRVIAGRKFRAGKPVSSREFQRVADDGLAIADDLAAIWRKRNRPSRLRDNLKALRAAANETAKLAR